MEYTQLPKEYKYDVIAGAMYAREVELFHYDFDRINFEYLLSQLPEGEYYNEIQKRLDDTVRQMERVIIFRKSLVAQIDDMDAYTAAVKRAEVQRECDTSK